jgi:hypothetical protein
MHLVHTYIAYRVSNICSVYRSGFLYVPDRHSYLGVRYAHQSANAVSCRGGVYSYIYHMKSFWTDCKLNRARSLPQNIG